MPVLHIYDDEVLFPLEGRDHFNPWWETRLPAGFHSAGDIYAVADFAHQHRIPLDITYADLGEDVEVNVSNVAVRNMDYASHAITVRAWLPGRPHSDLVVIPIDRVYTIKLRLP